MTDASLQRIDAALAQLAEEQSQLGKRLARLESRESRALYQPYYKGKHLDKDKYGYDGEEWGSFPTNYGLDSVYIGADVDKTRTAKV